MAEITLDQCLHNNRYKYQHGLTPVENYQYFHQAISFSRGVEFFTDYDGNGNGKFKLILYDLPGMSSNVKTARSEFQAFYKKLDTQIDHIINTEQNGFERFGKIYELFKQMQVDLQSPAPDSFAAFEKIYENKHPVAELKKKGIRLRQGQVKRPYSEAAKLADVNVIQWDQLPWNIREYIFFVPPNP